jgi:CRISPR system Cascade subunit CasD
MPNTLFLILEGPLQAWGEKGRWSIRDTAPEPTKSGVVGLLACALGLQTDEDLVALSQQVRMGVRCDQPGVLLVDYHTVSGGVLSAKGKVKKTASTGEIETVVSQRSYLCDASFLVAIQAVPDLIERLAEAIHRPCWPIYLGRKSCPPARPLYAGVDEYADLASALSSKPTYGPEGGTQQLRAVIECSPYFGVRRRDEIISRSARTYGPRYACETLLTIPIQTEVE